MADDANENGGILGWAGGVIAAAYQAVTKDGVLGASLNQGRDELATALKAFPDSIQGEQAATAWGQAPDEGMSFGPVIGPAGGEAIPSQTASPLPSPSDIAKDRPASMQVAEVKKTWVEKEEERSKKAGNGDGNDQNSRERVRILPIEQQQKDNGRGR